MTTKSTDKSAARERMKSTGESYATALAAVRSPSMAEPTASARPTKTVTIADPRAVRYAYAPFDPTVTK